MDLFAGEFLNHPCPLEVSFGNSHCSNLCQYCFVNVRGSKPLPTAMSEVNLLERFANGDYRDSARDKIFQAGYPVCLSNRTDPFCRCNFSNSRIYLSFLNTNFENPVWIQTKGGEGLDWYLNFLKSLKKKGFFYITIETPDDDIAASISKAPPPSLRMRQAERAAKDGHYVLIGINPYSHKYTHKSKTLRFIDEMVERGCNNFAIQGLYAFGDKEDVNRDIFEIICEANIDAQVINPAYPNIEYLDAWGNFGTKTFPLITPYISACFDKIEQEPEYQFLLENFMKFYELDCWIPLDEDFGKLHRFWFAFEYDRAYREHKEVQEHRTLREVLTFLWNQPKLRRSIRRFNILKVSEKKDENGNLIYERRE